MRGSTRSKAMVMLARSKKPSQFMPFDTDLRKEQKRKEYKTIYNSLRTPINYQTKKKYPSSVSKISGIPLPSYSLKNKYSQTPINIQSKRNIFIAKSEDSKLKYWTQLKSKSVNRTSFHSDRKSFQPLSVVRKLQFNSPGNQKSQSLPIHSPYVSPFVDDDQSYKTPIKKAFSENLSPTKMLSAKLHSLEIRSKKVGRRSTLNKISENVQNVVENDSKKYSSNIEIKHKEHNLQKLKKELNLQLFQSKRLYLPYTFDLLFKKFQALETTMNMYFTRNHYFVTFGELKKSIQMITKKNFTNDDLLNILFIMPAFFILKWSVLKNVRNIENNSQLTLASIMFTLDNAQNLQQLLFGFYRSGCSSDMNNMAFYDAKDIKMQMKSIGNKNCMKMNSIKDRERIFKYRMFQFVQKSHAIFLEKHSLLSINNKQLLKSRHWHRKFSIENDVQNIGLFPLPAMKKSKKQNVQKIVKQEKYNLEKMIEYEVSKIMKNKSPIFSTPDSKKKISPSVTPIPDGMKHLSPSIFANARAKQKIVRMDNRRNDEILLNNMKSDVSVDDIRCGLSDNTLKVRWSNVAYLVNLIRSTFVSMRKTAMPYLKLIRALQNNHRNDVISRSEIILQVELVKGMKCNFLTVRKCVTMSIVRCNYKKVDMNVVMKEIEEHT